MTNNEHGRIQRVQGGGRRQIFVGKRKREKDGFDEGKMKKKIAKIISFIKNVRHL